MSLDQVLSGAPENTATIEETERPVTTETTTQTDTATTTEAAQPETGTTEKPAAMPAAKPEPATMPYAAYKAEKDKRQELEQQLQQARQTQGKQEQAQPPGFWEKPEEHLAAVTQRAELAALTHKLDVLEVMARRDHPDYDEKLETFAGLVKENPILRVQMLRAQNPAEFMYSTAKHHAEFQAAGSIEKMRERIEAEVRAKVETEMKAKADAEAAKRAAVPTTLTGETGAPAPKAGDTGPTPLSAILNQK